MVTQVFMRFPLVSQGKHQPDGVWEEPLVPDEPR